MKKQFDVAVVGLGPAGRSLAHRLAGAGMTVLGIDPHPRRSWPHTLGGWKMQLPGWLPADVVALTAADPLIRAAGDHPIREPYAVLDNDALQAVLTLDAVTVEEGILDDDGVAALRGRARIVVDARGSRPAGHDADGPHQTAHGVFAPASVAAPVLGGAEAILMDWRPFDGAKRWDDRPPTFLYAIPMPGDRVLLEETCLAGLPGLGQKELRRRLLVRLATFGLPAADVEKMEVERVSIPLVRRGPHVPGVWRFGAAGAQNNPFSGYTFFASLSMVDDWVRRIRDDDMPRRDHPDVVRRRDLHALLNLSADDTFELFEAFGRLPSHQQMAVLDPRVATRQLLAAMTMQFMRMPVMAKVGLAKATLLR